MKCPICDEALNFVFKAHILHKYHADFTYCNGCGFLKAHEPHWLEEAYSQAIASTDTGLVARNYQIAEKLAAMLYFAMGERGAGRYLDAAGGYGLLTRLMRDYGFNFYWSDKYCPNLLAPAFEFNAELNPCQAVTAFEVMEHLEDPAGFVSEALKQANCDTFIFSTVLFNGRPPAPDEWWFYSFDTGQHIAFFQQRTLELLARRLGLRFYSCKTFFIFTTRALSVAMLKFCTSRTSYLIAALARRRLGTRTMTDHVEMVRRLRSGSEMQR